MNFCILSCTISLIWHLLNSTCTVRRGRIIWTFILDICVMHIYICGFSCTVYACSYIPCTRCPSEWEAEHIHMFLNVQCVWYSMYICVKTEKKIESTVLRVCTNQYKFSLLHAHTFVYVWVWRAELSHTDLCQEEYVFLNYYCVWQSVHTTDLLTCTNIWLNLSKQIVL